MLELNTIKSVWRHTQNFVSQWATTKLPGKFIYKGAVRSSDTGLA